MNFSRGITKSFIFPPIVWICLHTYEFGVKTDEYEEIFKILGWVIYVGSDYYFVLRKEGMADIMNVDEGMGNGS